MISAPYLIVVLLALQVVQCHKISLSRLEQRIEAVEEDVADLKSEVEMNVIKVLLGSGAEAEDGECYKLCAGDSGRGSTTWRDGGFPAKVYTRVDITNCGFTSPPIITTAVSGNGHHDKNTGQSAPFEISATSFQINLLGATESAFESFKEPTVITRHTAAQYGWHVLYVAVGYVC